MCQALTTVHGVLLSGSAQGPKRPGETTVRVVQAVLKAQVCLVPRACQANGEKRDHLA